MSTRKIHKVPVLTILIYFVCATALFAKDFEASLAYLPVLIEDSSTGGYVEFLKAIDEEYTEGKIIRKVYPFERSIQNVLRGKADFHMPLIVNPLVHKDSLPYRYSTEDIGLVVFVLYTNAKNPITRKDLLDAHYKLTESDLKQFTQKKGLEGLKELKNREFRTPDEFLKVVKTRISPENFKQFNHELLMAAFPYTIETDRAHVHLFEFPIQSNSSIESGLMKVNIKRIDGFVFAQEESDYVIRKRGLINTKREFYQEFEVKFVLPKDKKGDEADNILTKAIRKLKANGIHGKLSRIVHSSYKDWQP